MLCHKPSVWLSGITPLIFSIGVGQRRRRRHDQRRGRRQAERPHAADAEIRGRADRAIVRAAHAVRHLAREQPAEDQAEAPRHQRRQHREQADERGGAPAVARKRRQSPDHGVDRRRRGHRVAGDDDHRHLHREGDEVPEAGAEPLRRLDGRAARRPARPTNTTATAASASANASGNQRSNQSDRRRPTLASVEDTGFSCVWLRSLCICGTLRQPSLLRNT